MEIKIISPVTSAEYEKIKIEDTTLNINNHNIYNLVESDGCHECDICDLFSGDRMVNCIYCGFCTSGTVFKRQK